MKKDASFWVRFIFLAFIGIFSIIALLPQKLDVKENDTNITELAENESPAVEATSSKLEKPEVSEADSEQTEEIAKDADEIQVEKKQAKKRLWTVPYVVYYIFFILLEIATFAFIFLFHRSVLTLQTFNNFIRKDDNANAIFSGNSKLENKAVNKICEAYSETFIKNPNWIKTRSNADLYFGADTWVQDINPLPISNFLRIIPGTFIGFGILGTFIGFASGISGIDFSSHDVDVILSGVYTLLNGVGSAFITSIVGVIASILLNFLILHPESNRLEKESKNVCDYLDSKFYITEIDALMQYSVIVDENNNKMPFSESLRTILNSLKSLSDNMDSVESRIGEKLSNLGDSIENIKGSEFKQVLKAVQQSLGKAIDDEIEKLKVTMQTNISSLKECEKALNDSARVLQNAPDKLKDAADELQRKSEIAVEQFEENAKSLFTNFETTVQQNLNDKFDSYAESVNQVSNEMVQIQSSLTGLPLQFKNIEISVGNVTKELQEKEEELRAAIERAADASEESNNLNEKLSHSYELQVSQFNDMLQEYKNVLDNYKKNNENNLELIKGFEGLDQKIAGIFQTINTNTEQYGIILGQNLSQYLDQFAESTKNISAKFADATLVLSEEVSKLNSKK